MLPVNAAAPLPTGTVTVYAENGNQTSCTATLDSTAAGVCSIAAPAFGHTTVQAVYSGDANYAAYTLSGAIRVADNTAQLDVYVIKLDLGGVPTAFTVGDTATVTVMADPGCCFPPESTPPTLNLVWTSSNPAVATVVAGTVTAVSAGTATITATDTASQATGSLVVTVGNPTP
jgi:Bacterial Ig-like domain (group 3)/Bacterial Ig-like domain (group 2)